MMGFLNSLPSWAAAVLPGLAAFGVALAGMLASRRAEAWWAPVAALALLAGWAVAVPAPLAWWAPRVVAEFLVGAAVAGLAGCLLCAVLAGRPRRWAAFAGLLAAAWWLASAPAARGEFWRAWFGVAAVALLLRLGGGRTAAGVALVGGVLVSGSLAAGVSALWVGAMGVVLGAGLGVAVLRPGAVLSTVGPAVGVVALALGSGGLGRGRIGTVELACGAATVAPWVRPWVERVIGRRMVGKQPTGKQPTGRKAIGKQVARWRPAVSGVATGVLLFSAVWGAGRLLGR